MTFIFSKSISIINQSLSEYTYFCKMIENHFSTVEVKQQARYFTFGNPEAKEAIVVLHGYGQLAYYFLKKFSIESLQNYIVIAPEGLHRFYLEGSAGRVGASWMTKEWREQDLDTNHLYLSNLFDEISDRFPTIESWNLLGFSQGGATAARFWQKSIYPFKRLIMWATVFPPDVLMDLKSAKTETEKHFVVGSEDPYFVGDNMTEIIRFYSENSFEIHTFDGKHTIDTSILNNLF